MEYFVYILECRDNSLYVGFTNDLTRRMIEHTSGLKTDCYTFKRRPVILKHFITFDNPNDAIYWEKKLKKWSRAKKEAFMKKDWKKLNNLAECKNATSHKYNKRKEGRGNK
ncbi:MAG: GIY-YIG nuclease family protein [Bacteroidetes bacterium]|nr:GIY-YIG nuclease family protein [Bacteroidota bacterium]